MKHETHVNFTALIIGILLMLIASLSLKAQVVFKKDSTGNYVCYQSITHREVKHPIGEYFDGKGNTFALYKSANNIYYVLQLDKDNVAYRQSVELEKAKSFTINNP